MTTRQQHTETPETDFGAIVIYQTQDGQFALDVRLKDETLWRTQKQIAALFETERSVGTKHINNASGRTSRTKSQLLQNLQQLLRTGKHTKSAIVVRKSRTTVADGKSYQTTNYNLNVIISDGYRVKSPRGTQLRNRVIMSNFDGGVVEARAWRGGEACGTY